MVRELFRWSGVKVYQTESEAEALALLNQLRSNGYSCIQTERNIYECYIEIDHARYKYVMIVSGVME